MRRKFPRLAAYGVVTLLLMVALRYTPMLPEHPAAEVLQLSNSGIAPAANRPWSRTERLGLVSIGHIAFAPVGKGRRAELFALDSRSPASEARRLLCGSLGRSREITRGPMNWVEG